MVTLGRLVFKATGVLSNRGLAKNSRIIGEKIALTAKSNGGKLNTAEVKKIVEDTVGKKVASRINFLDRGAFKEQALKQGIPEAYIDDAFRNFAGITSPSKYARCADIFINENFAQGANGVNIVTHELQHALSHTTGKLSVRRGIFGKFSRGRKYLDKIEAKSAQADIDNKYMLPYISAIQQTQASGKAITLEEARQLLSEEAGLIAGNNKENIYILKKLKAFYQDEARSFSAGFGAADVYRGSTLPIYQEQILTMQNLSLAAKQELRQARLSRIKSFLGIKHKTSPIQQPSIHQAEPAKFKKAENNIGTNIFKKS